MQTKSLGNLITLGAALFVGATAPAQAGVTINLVDTGANIVATATGSLNMSALTDSIGFFAVGSLEIGGLLDFGGALGSSQGLVMGTGSYALRSGPTFAGPTYPFFGAETVLQEQVYFSSHTGHFVSLGFTGGATGTGVGIGVLPTYVSGSPISTIGTWTNREFDRLGVTAGSSFTWTWGTGETSDFLTINVVAVPEPSTYAMLLAGFGLVGYAARRKRV